MASQSFFNRYSVYHHWNYSYWRLLFFSRIKFIIITNQEDIPIVISDKIKWICTLFFFYLYDYHFLSWLFFFFLTYLINFHDLKVNKISKHMSTAIDIRIINNTLFKSHSSLTGRIISNWSRVPMLGYYYDPERGGKRQKKLSARGVLASFIIRLHSVISFI